MDAWKSFWMSCEKSLVLRERRNCFRELLGPELLTKVYISKYISLSFPLEWSCISVCLHLNYKNYHFIKHFIAICQLGPGFHQTAPQ